MRDVMFATLLAFVAACGGHRHSAPNNPDPKTLLVEIMPEGSHRGPLRAGAEAGLSAAPFAVPVDHGGEVELQIEVSNLGDAGVDTTCSVKILVMRLPNHDLQGIADGTARARGTHDQAEDDCIEQLGATLVRGKVRALLRQLLAAKR